MVCMYNHVHTMHFAKSLELAMDHDLVLAARTGDS